MEQRSSTLLWVRQGGPVSGGLHRGRRWRHEHGDTQSVWAELGKSASQTRGQMPFGQIKTPKGRKAWGAVDNSVEVECVGATQVN